MPEHKPTARNSYSGIVLNPICRLQQAELYWLLQLQEIQCIPPESHSFQSQRCVHSCTQVAAPGKIETVAQIVAGFWAGSGSMEVVRHASTTRYEGRCFIPGTPVEGVWFGEGALS